MGGLSFLSPLFLFGALAVAIPVVLHLFRRRDDPVVPFSAMRFLHPGADRAGAAPPAAGPAAAGAARRGAAAAGDRVCAPVPAVADVGLGGRRHGRGRRRVGEHGRCCSLRASQDAGATGDRQGAGRRPGGRRRSLRAVPTCWWNPGSIARRHARPMHALAALVRADAVSRRHRQGARRGRHAQGPAGAGHRPAIEWLDLGRCGRCAGARVDRGRRCRAPAAQRRHRGARSRAARACVSD